MARRGERRRRGLHPQRDPGLAQFFQRFAAKQRAEKKPIGLQCAIDLDESAGEIVDKMERQTGHHKIEAALQRTAVLPRRQRLSGRVRA